MEQGEKQRGRQIPVPAPAEARDAEEKQAEKSAGRPAERPAEGNRLQEFGDKLQDKIQDKLQLSDDNVLRLEKGKRGLLNILFGRTTVILLMLLAQALLVIYGFQRMQAYMPYLWVILDVVAVVVVMQLVNRAGEPTTKLTWILLIAVLPIFGTMLYLWIHMDIGHRLQHKRLEAILETTNGYVESDPALLETIREKHPDLHEMSTYMDRFGGFPVYENSSAHYFPSGEEKFEDLLVELEKAKSFIFLEYFIIEEGYMWGRILDILRRKVQEGVEVRVLYDGTCALYKLPYSYPKKMRALGIQCKMFAPPRPVVSSHYNNRDHRKILVIDGQVAYTGGVNLADEYINRKTLFGHWKDVAIKVQGEAVKSFTLMFLQMWDVETEDSGMQYEKYLQCTRPVDNGSGYLIPYGDSPLDNERLGEMVYCDMLNRAKRYVHIMSPYLILDEDMLTALTFAAKRGIQVQIILPHIPDKKYAFALAKTHYRQLMEAGVEIYEYLPGFVHAKVFTNDDEKAVVGTINLDYRSLYHHFECALYMHGSTEVQAVERDFQATLADCQRITKADLHKEKFQYRMLGVLLKAVAPLM